MIPDKFRLPAIGLFIGILCLAVPLLRDFHWESAGLASLLVAFYAGFLSSNHRNSTKKILYNSIGLLTGWAIPLIVYTIKAGCFSTAGAAFWIFGPFPSLLFGWATGRLFSGLNPERSRWYTVGVLFLFATVPTLAEFLNFPQLFFFNHVWSYWPGPIYDEIVNFDARLPLFRGVTLFWVAVFFAIPSFFQHHVNKFILLTAFAALLFSHAHRTSWGFIAPETRIQEQLGEVYETEHFQIFYSPAAFSGGDVEEWGRRHEDYLKEITGILEINRNYYRTNKIHSYIYSGSSEKKALTGAGGTSYVPVWLDRDQTHISVEDLERVLKHELVHVVAKQFGNRFGASSNIGLVEGLAVAIAPERHHSTADRLVAAGPEFPGVTEIRQLLSPVGFYRTSGPVSYLLSGSFVTYLINHYPVEMMKQAYFSGDLESAYYPVTLTELVSDWHTYLQTVDVGAVDRQYSTSVFSTPSLFQKTCPRVQAKREIRGRIAYNGAESITGILETCS